MADNLTMVPARPEVTQFIPCQANAIIGNKDIGNESAPIQLAECWCPGLAISNAKIWIYFSNKKFTEAILSDSNQKLLWFEIRKMLIAVLKDKFIVLSIIIFGTLVPVKSIAGGKDSQLEGWVGIKKGWSQWMTFPWLARVFSPLFSALTLLVWWQQWHWCSVWSYFWKPVWSHKYC